MSFRAEHPKRVEGLQAEESLPQTIFTAQPEIPRRLRGSD
jgi:hypothetical protein